MMITDLTRHSCRLSLASPARVTCLALAVWCTPALAQTAPDTPNTIYGMEIGLRSGHADRGFLISDRLVAQPEAWVSGRVAELSVWGNLPLAGNTDGSRPWIVEAELSRAIEWGNLSVAPAVRMFYYRDPLSIYNTKSVEGWLYLSYGTGPFRVFTNHSLDVWTYGGAYFGEAGIESEGALSAAVELGGSVGAGWASAKFNEAYAGLARSALDRVSVEAWLTVHPQPHFYVTPHVEFSTIVNDAVRAQLARPTFVLVRLSTGVEL